MVFGIESREAGYAPEGARDEKSARAKDLGGKTMNKLALMFLAPLIPLAITSADATTRIYKSFRQPKVCLTNIGWCSDF